MSVISLVVILDEKGGMGKNNGLLCHLPADLKHFKALTLGKPVIMGRHTFESIGFPLVNRLNVVLSRAMPSIAGVDVVSSIDDALLLAQNAPEIMIIGGAQIYQQFLPMAHQLYITTIHHVFDADVYFPPVDWKRWTLIESTDTPKDEKNKYDMTFKHYKKI